MRRRLSIDTSISLPDIIAAGLTVVAAGEMLAALYFASHPSAQSGLISSLLFWEAIAMFFCAGILHFRQEFGVSTVISLIAIWMAGAGIGLLRAGFFDAPPK